MDKNDKISPKKNQHFVPRFYLKRFSISENGKQITIFNKCLDKFIPSASLANQASAKFYYGKDGELENDLSRSEAIFAEVLGTIIRMEALPKYGSPDHRQLLHFAVMTESRNPVRKEEMEKITEVFGEYMKMHVSFPEKYRNENFVLKPLDPIAFSLLNHSKNVFVLSDLHAKLLVNETSTPFVTSDNPVVQYNQFLEQRTRLDCITGYGTKGLQIFIPISSRLTLMLYDSQIYYVGKKKHKNVLVTEAEVDQLNVLQLVNCDQMIYANDKIHEEYVRRLFNKARTLRNPREAVTRKTQTGARTFQVYHGQTSCKINLAMSFIAFTTHAARVEVTEDRVGYPREFALEVMDALDNDPRFQDDNVRREVEKRKG